MWNYCFRRGQRYVPIWVWDEGCQNIYIYIYSLCFSRDLHLSHSCNRKTPFWQPLLLCLAGVLLLDLHWRCLVLRELASKALTRIYFELLRKGVFLQFRWQNLTHAFFWKDFIRNVFFFRTLDIKYFESQWWNAIYSSALSCVVCFNILVAVFPS